MADVVRLLLRLPADLHAALAALARREQRSLHGQIVHLLRRGVESRDDGAPQPPGSRDSGA